MTGPPDLHQTCLRSPADPPRCGELEAVWGGRRWTDGRGPGRARETA